MASNENYDNLEKQVEDIKAALLGGELIPEKGLLPRFRSLEERMGLWERRMEKAGFILLGAMVLGGFGLNELIELLAKLLR